MIDVCCEYLSDNGYNEVAVLSSHTTKEFKIYSDRFLGFGISEIVSTEFSQEEIDKVILSVQGGDFNVGKFTMERCLNILYRSGAKVVVLGCTELPLVHIDSHVPVIDPGYLLLNKITDFLYEIP